jgi:3-oxoacyl-[acyl-carrier-protein] synthase II
MTANAVRAEDIVVSGWTATSPFGRGADALTEGLAVGRTAITDLDRVAWPGPFDGAALIPGFDVAEILGARGTRSMDRITGIVVSTVGMLLHDSGLLDQDGGRVVADPENVGLVLGSGGSVQSTMDFTQDALTGDKPYHVDPARFPNAVMNRAAGQSAIWYGLKGPNATVFGGAVTGLLALSYAARLLRFGRCDVLLCGAAEEFSSRRAWLVARTRGAEATSEPLGEGCVMLLVESAAQARQCGRRALVKVLATRFAAGDEPDGPRQALVRCITQALAGSGVDAGELRLVATSGAEGTLGKEEEAALADVLAAGRATGGPTRLESRRLLGDTSTASAAFQVAAVLAAARDRTDLDGAAALVTSVDPIGVAGCAVLRLYPDGRAA